VLGGPGQQTTAGIWRVSAGVCSCWKAMCSQSLHLSVRTCRPRESTSQKERALSPTENNKKNPKRFVIYNLCKSDRVMRQEEGNYITIRWYRPAENAFYRPIHRKFLTEKRENPRKPKRQIALYVKGRGLTWGPRGVECLRLVLLRFLVLHAGRRAPD
jgi:hypothetical protein